MTDGQPPEKPTQKMAQSEIQTELLNKLVADVADLKVTFTHGLGIVTDEVTAVKADLAEFKGETREKFKSHSIPIREGSQTNMSQDKALAHVIERLDGQDKTLAAQNETLATIQNDGAAVRKAIGAALKSPLGKQVLMAVAGAVIALATYVAGYFQAKGH